MKFLCQIFYLLLLIAFNKTEPELSVCGSLLSFDLFLFQNDFLLQCGIVYKFSVITLKIGFDYIFFFCHMTWGAENLKDSFIRCSSISFIHAKFLITIVTAETKKEINADFILL